MAKISKHDDINAVMAKAEQALVRIEEEYDKSLQEQNVPDSLLVEVKDCLGNMRSALDYLWAKMPGVTDGNFPVANSPEDFANKTTSLEAKYQTLLERWQPYRDQDWLQWLTTLNNKHKHVTLLPQARVETREFSVSSGGRGVTARGVGFEGNVAFVVNDVTVPIDPATQFPVDVPGAEVTRTIWVDFTFDTSKVAPALPSNISALSFLKTSFNKVQQLIQDVEGKLT